MAVPAGAAVAPTPEPAEKGESSAVSDAVSLLMLRANPGESPEGEAAPAAANESATKAVELGPAEVMTKVEEWSAPPAAAVGSPGVLDPSTSNALAAPGLAAPGSNMFMPFPLPGLQPLRPHDHPSSYFNVGPPRNFLQMPGMPSMISSANSIPPSMQGMPGLPAASVPMNMAMSIAMAPLSSMLGTPGGGMPGMQMPGMKPGMQMPGMPMAGVQMPGMPTMPGMPPMQGMPMHGNLTGMNVQMEYPPGLDPVMAALSGASGAVFLSGGGGPMRRRQGKAGREGWTRDEDAKIMQSVATSGQRWAAIAAVLPGRSDDAVRNRYLRLQRKKQVSEQQAAEAAAEEEDGDPAVKGERQSSFKKGEMWTEEEDELIMKAMMSFGQNWQAVSQRVPGRSAHAVRNRFLRELRSSTLRTRQPNQPSIMT